MRILETVLYAEDLAAAHRFYTNVLGLETILADETRHLFFRCEESVLILFKPSATIIPNAGVPPHGTTGAGHMAFAADDLEPWRERLTEARVPIIDEVAWPNGAHSIYFKDPAGNILEFATPNLWQ